MKKVFTGLVIAISLECLAWGCRAKWLSEADMKKYPNDPANGLMQRVEKGEFLLEMCYRPKDLIVSQDLDDPKDITRRKETLQRLDSMDYFVLRLSRDGHEIETDFATDDERFNEVINYLSFYISRDIFMVHEKDTIRLADLGYARTFGSDRATSLLAVFKSNLKSKKGNTSIYFDDAMLGTGLSEFEFKIKDIKDIPQLKVN